MDPDKALEVARTMVQAWEEAANSDAEHAAARELSSAFGALDHWLSHGGSLPSGWAAGREEGVPVMPLVREFVRAANDAIAAEESISAKARERITNRLLWGHEDGAEGIAREAALVGRTTSGDDPGQEVAAGTFWHLMTGIPVAPELTHPVFGADLREIDPAEMDENAHPIIATCTCGEEITRDAPGREWVHSNPEL